MTVRRELQRHGFDLLSAYPFLRREVRDIGIDRVVHVVLGERADQRVVERDLRDEIPFGGRGIERDVRGIAQPLQREQLGGRIRGALGAEARARRRWLRMGVRHLEDAVGQREFAPRRQIDSCAPNPHGRGAALHAREQVGIA